MVAVLVVIFAALIVLPSFSGRARVRRRISAVPKVRISDAMDGARVRIVGEVSADGETVRAPLSGREVVLWELSVWRQATGSNVGPVTRRRGHDFLVTDASGTALVRVEGAALSLAEDREETHSQDDAPSVLREVLEAAGNRFAEDPRAKLTGREYAVEQGETVSVVGVAMVEGEGGGRRVVISADPGWGLLLSDDAVADMPVISWYLATVDLTGSRCGFVDRDSWFWIDASHFLSGALCGENPLDHGAVGVLATLPVCDLGSQRRLVGDATVEIAHREDKAHFGMIGWHDCRCQLEEL